MPEETRPYKIFISHAGKDTAYAKMIGLLLESIGLEYFLDEVSLEGGDIIKAAIMQEMVNSNEVAMILTPNSMNRPFVWAEFGMAMAYEKRITVLVDDLTMEDVFGDGGQAGLLSDIFLMQLEDIDKYLEQVKRRAIIYQTQQS